MNLLKRYWDKIIDNSNEPDSNGCWNWQGAITGKTAKNTHAGGYGCFRLGRKLRYAHNLSYLLLEVLKDKDLSKYTEKQILKMLDEMRNGKSKVEGSHTCHNRRCVNPKHQVRESHRDNGRRPNGKNIKLDAVKVAEIKRRLLDGDTPDTLGARYKTTPSNISTIRHVRRWKGIKPAKKQPVPS
jgi:Zinc-binding loop region of homing endonuclease